MTKARGLLLPFNAQAIGKAKAVDGKRAEYRIDGVPGLILRVQPTGAAAWYFFYFVRIGKARKLRKLKLGTRDALTAHDARKQAIELLNQTTKGADPASERKARREALTFRELVALRFEKDRGLGRRTRVLWEPALNRDALPIFGDVPAKEVTAAMVVEAINKVEARDALTAADNLRVAISAIFSWGRKRQLVEHNPAQGLGRRSTSMPRTRTWTADELRRLYHVIDSGVVQLSEPMGIALKLTLLTGQRRDEVIGTTRSELALEGPDPIWTIKGDVRVKSQVAKGRTKNGREQIVPLSKQAAKLFERAVELAECNPHVFPASLERVKIGKAPRTPHIHGDSVSLAMRRVRITAGLDTDNAPTVHDLRRTIATWLGEQGERSDVIQAVLNHTPRDITRLHYNHARLTPFVRKAFQRWADHVDRVVAGSVSKSNVVELRTA